MKRSERKKELLEDLIRPGGRIQLPPGLRLANLGGVHTAEGMAERILAHEEALGAKWDPEEGPMPERLSLDPFGELSVPVERSVSGRYLSVREKREVKRRWNSWEKIRALTECLGDYDGPTHRELAPEDRVRRQRILAILDGKEGE